MPHRPQTRNEEVANGISHLLGIVFCFVAMPFALFKTYDVQNLVPFISVALFAVGMFLVYTFSTLYHLEGREHIKKHLKKLDHISIYFLIAGTYSPLILRYLDRETSIIFLSIMWMLVAMGVVYKLFFINRFEWLSVVLYLTMGWMLVFVLKPLIQNIPLSVFWWILAGGVSYTVGVYFYVKSYRQYFHFIWHILVLCGTIFHFISVYLSLQG
jgi:hemolysin III